jgi:hypothetical protein
LNNYFDLLYELRGNFGVFGIGNKTMATIVISDLHFIDVEIFWHEITPAQAETVLGGNTNTRLTTPSSSTPPTKAASATSLTIPIPELTVDNNKIFAIDFSRITVNGILMLPSIPSQIIITTTA